MPTLEELLKQNPDQLKTFLSGGNVQSEDNSSVLPEDKQMEDPTVGIPKGTPNEMKYQDALDWSKQNLGPNVPDSAYQNQAQELAINRIKADTANSNKEQMAAQRKQQEDLDYNERAKKFGLPLRPIADNPTNNQSPAVAAAPDAQPELTQQQALSRSPSSSSSASSPRLDINQQMLDTSHADSMNTVAGLKAAQDKANKETSLNNLNKAASMIQSGATAIAHKTKAPDISENTKFWDEQNKQAQVGVQQYKDLTEQEKNDPNSAASAKMRQIAQPMLQKIGIKLPEGMSFNEVEKNFPMFTKMYDVQTQTEARKDAMKDSALNRKALFDLKKQEKETESQSKTYNKTMNDITSYRGAKDVGNAAEALRNSDAAMTLINMNPDYNKMSNEQYNLLSAEIAKIATGGAATEAATKDAKASTIQSQAAHFWSQVKGSPTAAQLGQFIQQHKDYLTHLNDVNHKIVTNFKQAKLAGSFDGFNNEQKQDALLQHPDVAKNLGITEDQLNDPNFKVPKLGELLRSSKDRTQKLTPGQDVVTATNGKKYLVDHNTKKVIKEIQ